MPHANRKNKFLGKKNNALIKRIISIRVLLCTPLQQPQVRPVVNAAILIFSATPFPSQVPRGVRPYGRRYPRRLIRPRSLAGRCSDRSVRSWVRLWLER